MNREFLEHWNIGQEAVEAILAESQREEQEHLRAMEDLRFENALENGIRQMGGRNAVAIRALLNLEELKKGGEDAIRTALENLKKEAGYLFEEPAAPAFASGAGMGTFRRGYSQEELGRMSMAEYKAYRQGR